MYFSRTALSPLRSVNEKVSEGYVSLPMEEAVLSAEIAVRSAEIAVVDDAEDSLPFESVSTLTAVPARDRPLFLVCAVKLSVSCCEETESMMSGREENFAPTRGSSSAEIFDALISIALCNEMVALSAGVERSETVYRS